MADAKITALTEDTAPVTTDLLVMVDDPSGTPVTKKTTIATFHKITPGRFLRTTVLTSGTSHTTHTSANTIFVRLVAGGGAGGGGASATSNAGCGGGGSAGGYAEKTFTVTPNTAYTYAIGIGGTAGSAGNNPGNDGGITTFTVGGTTVTANGGKGGQGMASGSTVISALGGASPAVSTNGDLNSGGDPGVYGQRGSGTTGTGGSGGSSPLGAGANARNTQGAGNTASVGYGGGGGGGFGTGNNNSVAGGAGANGVIIVDEFS